MGLVSPGGQNLLDFLELRHVLSTYDGDLRARSGGLRTAQSPCELLRGVSGLISLPCPGLTLCGVGHRTLGFLSSADMDLGVLLESPQGSQSSSREGACTCAFLPSLAALSCFPSRRSWDLWLSLQDFPRGFPTRLSRRTVLPATVL